MIVSLEAIFLSTFVLISQNRFSDAADRRSELDLQIGLLAEHEITRVLQMLDAIQDKLGIENDADSELPTWRWRPDLKTSSPRLTACTARSKADVCARREGTPREAPQPPPQERAWHNETPERHDTIDRGRGLLRARQGVSFLPAWRTSMTLARPLTHTLGQDGD